IAALAAESNLQLTVVISEWIRGIFAALPIATRSKCVAGARVRESHTICSQAIGWERKCATKYGDGVCDRRWLLTNRHGLPSRNGCVITARQLWIGWWLEG